MVYNYCKYAIYLYKYTHTPLHTHKGHLIDKVNIAKGIGNRKHYLPFSKKLIVMGPFMSQKTVSMTFFTGCCAQNFFYCRVSMFPLRGLSFQLRLLVANPCFRRFVKIF